MATDTQVTFKLLKTGKEHTVPLDSLSQEDQDFIKDWRLRKTTGLPEPSEKTDIENQAGPSKIALEITRYASSRMRRKIGNGECWTLLDRAFKAVKLDRPGSRVWGKEIDWKTETIQPGDLLEIETATFSDGNKVPLMHSAIISKVTQNHKLTVLQQNSGRKRYITEGSFDLQKLQKGTVKIYRVLPSQRKE